jgi:nucleoside-diphosphate-sugar epimerase
MPDTKHTKIFLTGGTGFIGSHFLLRAGQQGIPVRALRRNGASKTRFDIKFQPEWIERQLDELLPNDFFGCDSLVHLASPGVSPQQANMEDLLYWNVLVFRKILDAAASAGIRRFIIAGTFAEYGRAADGLESIPSYCNLSPTTDYAAAKAAACMIAHSFSVTANVELCYLRIFSAYGEGQHVENFWPALRSAALAGEDFKMSPGEQIRDYIPVDQVANCFLDAATSGDFSPGQPKQFNIGSGQPTTMKDFAEKLWSDWNARGKLLVGALPYRPNEVMRYVPAQESLYPPKTDSTIIGQTA